MRPNYSPRKVQALTELNQEFFAERFELIDDLSVLRDSYINNSPLYSMKATKFTTKHTTICKSKVGFIESQILRFKASKNKVFVLTVIATLMVFVKWAASTYFSDMRQKILRLMFASMLTNSNLKMRIQNGSRFRIEHHQNDRRNSGHLWEERGSDTWITSSKW